MTVMLNSFQHLMFACPGNKEIPKRYKMSQRGTSCANLYAVAVRNDNRARAFTLAEVLITLVIIGVVAALTIPNLLAKHDEQQTVAKLKKTYAALVTAQRLSIAETGEDYDKKIHPYNAFRKYFKTAKNCEKTGTGCFATSDEYKTLGGKVQSEVLKILDIGGWTNKIILDDGVAIAFVPVSYGYVVDSNNLTVPYIVVDVNGIKPPNIFGRDTFMFVVLPNKIVPMGIGFNEPGHTCRASYCEKRDCSIKAKYINGNTNGIACTNWVITKGNMEYLKHDISE